MTSDYRRDLIARLERHRHGSFFVPEEREGWARMLAFVARRPQCFERTNLDGHVTGSAWILDAAGEQVILLHHKKLGAWLQPGGHADGDPDVARVATKEAIEETGIEDLRLASPEIFDVDVHAIPARAREPAHFHYDVRFLFRAPPGAEPRVSDESHALAWVSRGRVSHYTRDRSVLRMLAKWEAGLIPGGSVDG